MHCIYCRPEREDSLGDASGRRRSGWHRPDASELLTSEELEEIVGAAAALGIRKLKITGGEPLVRPDCADLIGRLRRIPGIEQVTLTTNGVLLSEFLPALREAGLDAVNLSLDTRNRRRYAAITGADALPAVLKGMEEALCSGLPVKINAVLQQDPRGANEADWSELAALAKDLPLDVRFIEMMPIGSGAGFLTVSNAELLRKLRRCYPNLRPDGRKHGNGPAVYYRIPGFLGSIGFISAMSGRFCAGCNRIRLTASGVLKPCLCFGGTVDLKAILRTAHPKPRYILRQVIADSIREKPREHCFETPEQMSECAGMSTIGG